MDKRIEHVRLLITDTNPDAQVFTDEQLDMFLELTNGIPGRAAAKALRTIAASEVLVSKVIKTQDLSTDGARVAETLLKLATQLDIDADKDDDALSSDFYTVQPAVEAPAWLL